MADFQIDIGNTITMLTLIEQEARTARESLALKLKYESQSKTAPDLVLAQSAPHTNGNGRLHFPGSQGPAVQASPAQIAAAKGKEMTAIFIEHLNALRQDAALLESQLSGGAKDGG